MTLDQTTVYLVVAAAFVVAAVIVSIAISRGRRRETRSPVNPYVEGLTRLIEGDRAEAFELFQKAVRSGTAPTDAYIRLGRMLRERGEPSRALQIHKGLTVKTDLSRSEKIALFVNIAEDYAALGRPEQAVSVLDGAVGRLGLRDAIVHRILARESHRMGGYERAYNYLREMKKTGDIDDAELAAYLAEAGRALIAKGDDRGARRTLQRALKHDPDCAMAHLLLGDMAEKAGDEDEAITRWSEAARLSTALAPRALTHLERVTFGRGTFSEMEQTYRDVLAARDDDEVATLALASFLRKQRRDEEATRILEEFHERHPQSIGAILLLVLLYQQSDRQRMERFLQKNAERFVRRAGDEGAREDTAAVMPWH